MKQFNIGMNIMRELEPLYEELIVAYIAMGICIMLFWFYHYIKFRKEEY